MQITKKILAATLVILSLFTLTTSKPASAAGRALPCVVSSGKWVDLPLFQSETGIFRIAYDATPSNSAVDGVTGLASSPANAYTSLAAIVRFNSTGTIDAMSGSNYTAATVIPYAANVTYHFIMDVNMATHTYSAYVMLGSVQTTIGANLTFRSTQAAVTSLAYLGAMTTLGSHSVCNIALSSVPAAASIIRQPVSATVNAGQSATFSMAAAGTAPLTFQWMKNGAAISGAVSSTYATPPTTMADNGAQFTVSVTNTSGVATSNAAVLTVTAPVVAPSISGQPVGQSVTVGQSATFFVAVSGSSPITYQWKKNGSAISGATSMSYTTPATLASDNGSQFSVVVSNTAGSATSNAAALTVTPAPVLLLNSNPGSLNFGNVNVSSSSALNITLTNAGNTNVTISQVTVAGAGFNTGGSNGVILTPGQSTTLTATFAPATTGATSGQITVSSNASNSPSSISLSGTGVSPTPPSVALSWSDSVSGVMGYNAYSSTVSGGPYAKLTTTPVTSPSFTDTTVQSGTTYYYVVTAIDSSEQESTYSAQVTAIVP